MNLKDLTYFAALAEQKQFTAVSEQFGVTQPTISYALKRLEEEFESALIVRDTTKKSVVLTKTGQLVYELAVKLGEKLLLQKKKSHYSQLRSCVLDCHQSLVCTTFEIYLKNWAC